MKTIIEPFRIKMVEPLKMTTRDERDAILRQANFNPFLIRAEDVLIDLLTDSGTSAMSAEQWAGMLRGDESYAGAKSWFRFESVMKELTGMPFVLPTHRAGPVNGFFLNYLAEPAKLYRITITSIRHGRTWNIPEPRRLISLSRKGSSRDSGILSREISIRRNWNR